MFLTHADAWRGAYKKLNDFEKGYLKKGYVNESSLTKLWETRQFKDDDIAFLIKLMKEYDLMFEVKTETGYLFWIPICSPKEAKDAGKCCFVKPFRVELPALPAGHCGICHRKLDKKDETITCCGEQKHLFHKSCAQGWFQGRQACPLWDWEGLQLIYDADDTDEHPDDTESCDIELTEDGYYTIKIFHAEDWQYLCAEDNDKKPKLCKKRRGDEVLWIISKIGKAEEEYEIEPAHRHLKGVMARQNKLSLCLKTDGEDSEWCLDTVLRSSSEVNKQLTISKSQGGKGYCIASCNGNTKLQLAKSLSCSEKKKLELAEIEKKGRVQQELARLEKKAQSPGSSVAKEIDMREDTLSETSWEEEDNEVLRNEMLSRLPAEAPCIVLKPHIIPEEVLESLVASTGCKGRDPLEMWERDPQLRALVARRLLEHQEGQTVEKQGAIKSRDEEDKIKQEALKILKSSNMDAITENLALPSADPTDMHWRNLEKRSIDLVREPQLKAALSDPMHRLIADAMEQAGFKTFSEDCLVIALDEVVPSDPIQLLKWATALQDDLYTVSNSDLWDFHFKGKQPKSVVRPSKFTLSKLQTLLRTDVVMLNPTIEKNDLKKELDKLRKDIHTYLKDDVDNYSNVWSGCEEYIKLMELMRKNCNDPVVQKYMQLLEQMQMKKMELLSLSMTEDKGVDLMNKWRSKLEKVGSDLERYHQKVSTECNAATMPDFPWEAVGLDFKFGGWDKEKDLASCSEGEEISAIWKATSQDVSEEAATGLHGFQYCFKAFTAEELHDFGVEGTADKSQVCCVSFEARTVSLGNNCWTAVRNVLESSDWYLKDREASAQNEGKDPGFLWELSGKDAKYVIEDLVLVRKFAFQYSDKSLKVGNRLFGQKGSTLRRSASDRNSSYHAAPVARFAILRSIPPAPRINKKKEVN
eukprot:TRINITY_DN3122_c0_g1_i3.p1 TRINITY_DN3122_c0_g1~~TRINITY_DN3122_c0_g1_i3.p1  ORF type:complete len:924 (+),score=166.54 TRINITY_DN3122_c0_g1_i3:849-3620(+)